MHQDAVGRSACLNESKEKRSGKNPAPHIILFDYNLFMQECISNNGQMISNTPIIRTQ